MDITLTRGEYEKLIWAKGAQETIHDQTRWAVVKTWIVEYKGKHYETESVDVAATEYQETDWPHEMTLREVELKEVVTKQWVPVQS